MTNRFDAMSQREILRDSEKLDVSLITKNVAIFIAIPAILLFTILNILLIIGCSRRKIDENLKSRNNEDTVVNPRNKSDDIEMAEVIQNTEQRTGYHNRN